MRMKRYVPILLLALLPIACPAFGAVTEDAHSNIVTGSEYDFPCLIQWEHTCTGADILIVGVAAYQVFGGAFPTVASSLDGALTEAVKSPEIPDDPMSVTSHIFYIISPSNGTHTVTVTFPAEHQLGYPPNALSVSYVGVDTSDPFEGTFATSADTGTTASSGDLTSTSGGMTVDALGISGRTVTAGTGQTVFGKNTYSGFSYEAESTGMSWTWSTNAKWRHCGVQLKAAAGGEEEEETPPSVIKRFGDQLMDETPFDGPFDWSLR